MKKTILIVDDEEVALDISRRKLIQAGYSAIGVTDGEKALQVLREGPVDLIVLDVEMPNMNGYTFLTERKKIVSGDNAPVIILTAYDSLEPIFKRHGVRAYLRKPLTLPDLVAKVKEVIEAPVPAPEV